MEFYLGCFVFLAFNIWHVIVFSGFYYCCTGYFYSQVGKIMNEAEGQVLEGQRLSCCVSERGVQCFAAGDFLGL